MKPSIAVVAAHVGDWVWRCGGAIATHVRQDIDVHVVCLSFGENGESNAAWKDESAELAQVKAIRRAEAEEAARILGVTSIEFLDQGDYPMPQAASAVDHIARVLRRVAPLTVLTHPERDPSNMDHCRTFSMVLDARMKAQAPGHGRDFITPPQILSFEPHQPELCDFKPSLLLDITEVWPVKLAAMHALPTQRNLWAYYERVAMQRGAQAGRRSTTPITHAEAFHAVFPQVRGSLI
jgi:4-oxalomesaconate hydratase